MPSPLAEPDRRRVEPLWDRVDRNRWKLGGYVALFVVVSVVSFDLFIAVPVGMVVAFVVFPLMPPLWWLLADPFALMGIISAVVGTIAAAWATFTIMRSEKWLLKVLDATLVPKGVHVESKSALKDMAIAAGFETAPALYVIDTPNVNAFIVAARRRRAVVGVTRGLLERFSVSEQRAVFANLMARLRSGDTIVATGVSALMWPLSVLRDRQFLIDDERTMRNMGLSEDERMREASSNASAFLSLGLFAFAFVFFSEFVAVGNRAAQLRAAEKADSEAMLLLKDPLSMLKALEKTVRLNNSVPVADHSFGQIFYCWPGASTDDENDPEWRRVARLREVLGAEGSVWRPEGEALIDPARIEAALPPEAPRLDGHP